MRTRTLFTAIICVAALAALPADAGAQGFLKKIKQKAEKTISIVTGTETPAEETASDAGADEADAVKPTATDRLPKLRQSSVVWDGEVTPSRAADVRALMNELSALPTADEIANPTDAARNAYQRKLSALSMRAGELDDELSCSDEEMLAARDKMYKELEGIIGLTSEEIKRLEDPGTSEAEKQRLEEKMSRHVLGGADADALSAKAQSKEGRMKEIEKEMNALEKKEEAGTLTAADQQRMMQLGQEAMAMQQDLMGSGLGNLMEISRKGDALSAKVMAETAELEKRVKAFATKQAALRKNEAGVVKDCSQIAGEYEARLQDLYSRIWAESDVDKIHALYDEADALMKNYRTRAAKVYLKGLQLRLDNTRKLLPEAEAVYADMADGGMIPKCATRRAPLNVVIDCIDILRDAYAYFPQPDVLPCKQSTLNIPLKKDEHVLYGESGFAGSSGGSGNGVKYLAANDTTALEKEFFAGCQLLVYSNADQCYYKVEGDKRTRLDGDGPFDFHRSSKRDDSVYGDIPLRKGGRKAVFSRDGSLTLHDGTVFYPLAMQRSDEWLIFIINDYNKHAFVKCLYKL